MSAYQNIPQELQELPQWIVWKLVERENLKPTKIPIQANGWPADVTNPDHWCDFQTAVRVSAQYSGIGFCFSKRDPYCGIDLDNTCGDAEAFATQEKIYEKFKSYTEFSPSGKGLHIIIKAKLPGRGRRRQFVEIYDADRYFTFTGNVYRNLPCEDFQELADTLYGQMGGPPQHESFAESEAQTKTDEEIITIASHAENANKFIALFSGQWVGDYQSQSEADMALVDIIQFYTKNKEQIARIYAASALGKTKKDNYEHRSDRRQYVAYMIEKSFDRALPPVDIDGLNIALEKLAVRKARTFESGTADKSSEITAVPNLSATPPSEDNGEQATPYVAAPKRPSMFPPGLVGEIADFILAAAPLPVPEIALAGAIGFLAGIVGRAYNVSGTGLNQYVLVVARTGRGKEAIAGGIDKIMEVIKPRAPQASSYIGPTQIASPQAIIKWLGRDPCCYSIIGEFGLKMKDMTNPNANPNIAGLKTLLLELYHKSGKSDTVGASAYSKREDNTAIINSPAFTLIAESTPLRLYENLNEDMIAEGLLSRFFITDYSGQRVKFNKKHKEAFPPFDLIERLISLMAHCAGMSARNSTQEIPITIEAEKLFDDFSEFTRKEINKESKSDVTPELWNRAHLKAMKLAAIYAVGDNPFHPEIIEGMARMAINEVYGQTMMLKSKFDRGEVGGGSVNTAANDVKQADVMAHVIGRWATSDWELSKKFRVSQDMHRDKVFPLNALHTALGIYPVFRNDRRGSRKAIDDTYKAFLDNDDLREVPKIEMEKRYNKKARAFAINNAERFLEDQEE